MAEPDEALLWAIESWAADKGRGAESAETETAVAFAEAMLPRHDAIEKIVILNRARGYRAGQAAAEARIKDQITLAYDEGFADGFKQGETQQITWERGDMPCK